MRSEQEANRALELYSDTVRRICMVHLKNYADTEDIFQTVFLKYVLSSTVFKNEEHEKAWFIRVTINACKDLLKSFFRSRTVPLEESMNQAAPLTEEDMKLWKLFSRSRKNIGMWSISIIMRVTPHHKSAAL